MENKTTYTPDWATIPGKYKWVAVDADGTVFAFSHKPRIEDGVWENNGHLAHIDAMPAPDGETWKTMIYQRPKPATT